MQHIRNIAIIAHVDHGKTTLVDCLLKQSGTFRANQAIATEERIMDSMDLEREKGITIKAKNAAFKYKDYHVNIVDTPGHADFGGEVERIMNMIDGVLLVVDAADGPQAQTRFVLRKALEAGAKPIVVINKIDRENADPHKVLDAVWDLFVSLHATDEQMDFPVIYASAKDGYAKTDLKHVSGTMEPLFDAIIKHIPPPRAHAGEGFKLLAANLDYSDYLGRIAFGKIYSGKVKVGDTCVCIHGDGRKSTAKITAIFHFEGLKRIEIPEAHAGDVVGLTGFEDVFIGETITDSEDRAPLPFVPIDPPTIQMQFAVNDGPLAGIDGQLVTARHIWERLVKEVRTNVALRIEQTDAPNIFNVSGRGEMQIAILVEQMRREGHEVLVSRPEVIYRKDKKGNRLEPIEQLFLETPKDAMGVVLENLAGRKGGDHQHEPPRGPSEHRSADPDARPDRLRDRPGQPDARPGRDEPSFSRIRAGPRRNRRAQERLAGQHGKRRSDGLRPEHDPGTRPADGRAGRRDLRRHDRGRKRARKRHPGQSLQSEEADQHALAGRRQRHPAQSAAQDVA